MKYIPFGVRVEDLDSEDISCLSCGTRILSEAFYVDELAGQLCGSCVESYVTELEDEAKTLAREQCQITEALPRFDAENQFRCSPRDFEMGMKASNTPNAYLAKCRHEYTNYETLIRPFDRSSDSLADRISYATIRDKIDEMVITEIERSQPEIAYEFGEFITY